jgi:hypothetical protein
MFKASELQSINDGSMNSPYEKTFSRYENAPKENPHDNIRFKHDENHKYHTIVDSAYSSDNEDEVVSKKKSIAKYDPIAHFYLASLSVVGLFVLYRYFQKSK